MLISISQRLAWPVIAIALVLASVLASVLAPAVALAGKTDPAKARQANAHVANASKAHQEGRYDAARVELEAAYALDPRPDFLYALGQVHAKLGHCRDATTYFQRFVATQKDPQIAKVIDQAIAECKPADTSRLPPPGQPAGVGQSQRSAWYRDKLGNGLVIGGVAATIVGLIAYRSALSELDAAEDRTRTTTLARYQELVDSAHGKRRASVAFAGVGGALIAGGIVHYVLHGRRAGGRDIGVAPAGGGGVLTYRGRF